MTLGPKPPPDGGTGPNLIRPQTCSLAFRCAPKQPQNSGRICLANRSQGNVTGLPHPPPKGHACLIRTTSCNECPVPIFSSICFLRIRFRWIQMRGAPTSTDDRRKFPLLRFPNAIVFPSIYLFRIWLQIGPDARNNAKQADDVVQDLGTSRKPAAFDNADGPIWTVGE